jgi:lipopolysaccharide/colanic/teichoic acid biosynthesis glycosyltransferase
MRVTRDDPGRLGAAPPDPPPATRQQSPTGTDGPSKVLPTVARDQRTTREANGVRQAATELSRQHVVSIKGDSTSRRVVDWIVSAVALVVLSPLLVVLAIVVKLVSPGPAIYVQERIGKGCRPFPILKFRSMTADADRIGPLVSGRSDPHVTRVGRLLRATKLDELPQLVNVLRGDMTLIGPRADVARYVAHFTVEERALLLVRPGLTGPSAVYFTTDQAGQLDDVQDPDEYYIRHQLHAKLAMDLAYLRGRSLVADLSILWRTVLVFFPARRPTPPDPHPSHGPSSYDVGGRPRPISNPERASLQGDR